MARTAHATVLVFVLLAGTILLQVFLSRRERKWPGLVLPGIFLLYSIVMVLNVAAVSSAAETVGAILSVLITGNIPTLILLAIYAACREKRRKRREMNQMRIEDL